MGTHIKWPAIAITAGLVSMLAACGGHRFAAVPGLDDHPREDVVLSAWKPTGGQKCTIVAVPRVLPGIATLLDTTTMPIYLAQGGIANATGSTLLSLKFDTAGAPKRARVIETTLSEEASGMLQMAVASALLNQPSGDSWGLRIRIDLGPALTYRVGRSELCAPQPTGHHGNDMSIAQTMAIPVDSRVVSKSSTNYAYNVLVGSDGSVLAAAPTTPFTDAELAAILYKEVISERWMPGLDDRMPVTMKAVRVQLIKSETRIMRVPME